MELRTLKLTGTTDGSGALVVDAPGAIYGKLEAIEWIDGTFDDGVGGVITVTKTPSGVDHTLLTLAAANNDAIYYPRTLVHKTEDGAALTGTAGGDRTAPLVAGYPRLTVSSGGNAKTGGCVLYYWS